jgi:hypothetical protein
MDKMERARELLREEIPDRPEWQDIRADIRDGSTDLHSDGASFIASAAIRAITAALSTPSTDSVLREGLEPGKRSPSYHGEYSDAVEFALYHNDDISQTYEFLKAWNEGALDEWPEFYEWLSARAALQSSEADNG